MLKRHWGSIAGGSFLNAFFNVLDFFFEAFRCYPDGVCNNCAGCCDKLFGCVGSLFDLVRTDAYSYINLAGIPYCNACRNC